MDGSPQEPIDRPAPGASVMLYRRVSITLPSACTLSAATVAHPTRKNSATIFAVISLAISAAGRAGVDRPRAGGSHPRGTRIKLNEFVVWIAPWQVLPLLRASTCCDRCAERAAGASSPSIQHVVYSARRGERHTLCHRSERHAARLDRDTVFRFQALFRAYRSISTIAHWKPIALHVSRPLCSRYRPLARDHSRRGSFRHDMTCRFEPSGPS